MGSNLEFPAWNPQLGTIFRMRSINKKKAFKAFRNSCGGFITKKIVRQIVFERDDFTCNICGSNKNLTIDHIKSVVRCFQEEELEYCNLSINLQTLCKSCNSKKAP